MAKQLIEQAEYNFSGEKIQYEIDSIEELSEEGAYLVIASCEYVTTSFVCYEDGTAYFLYDWQGRYPKNEEEIKDYSLWVDINWNRTPFIFNGLPRVLC